MRRLINVVIFTKRFEAMKTFYRDRIGLLPLPSTHEDWIAFDTGGTRIALHRMDDPQHNGVALRFEAGDLDAEVEAMAARGVTFVGAARDLAWGRFAEFRDPEENLVGLLQGADAGGEGRHPLDRVVLSCSRFVDTVHFYRERIGLKPTVDTERWVEFDTGEARLALHPRRRDGDHPPHTEQNITIVFRADDLMSWVEDMRGRDVIFATAPIEEDFGLYAEAADPDGYVVVFREPPPPVSLEEELAAAYEDDEAPHQIAIRKPAQKPSKASGVIASLKRHSRREAEEARRERAAAQPPSPAPRKLAVVAPRGTGAAGARQKPKTTRDPKRAKAKPAIGSLKESTRQTITAKKRSVAGRSKSRPVKAAVKRTATRQTAPARAVPKRAAKRVAAPARAVPKRAAKRKSAPSRPVPKRAAKRKAAPARAAVKRTTTRKAARGARKR